MGVGGKEALSRKRKRENPGMQGGKREWRLRLGGNGNAVHTLPALLKTPHMLPVVFFSYYYFVNLTTLALGFFNGQEHFAHLSENRSVKLRIVGKYIKGQISILDCWQGVQGGFGRGRGCR